MKKQLLMTALCTLLAACGGEDGGSGGNDAIDHTFEYGPPMDASPSQAMVLQNGLSTMVSLSEVPSAQGAIALASINILTSTLLGSPIGAAAAEAMPAAARPDGFEDCIVVTATTITFDHCELIAAGSTTITDGWFEFSAGDRTFRWDLDVTSDSVFGGYSSEARYHQSGDLAFTDSTIRGNMLAELGASVSGSSFTYAYEMSEAVILDLTYQFSPPCITGGTLEARRVWTQRPDGLPAASAPDRGVKITWTGCNEATIATSI